MAWINFFGDKVRIKDIFLRNGKCLADVFYPVGSIYISAASTSPADMFGGTWKQIKGRFLLGADSSQYKHLCNENESFTLNGKSHCRFGKGDKWIEKDLEAGTYTASLGTFGGTDPAQGVTKEVQIRFDAGLTGGEETHTLTMGEVVQYRMWLSGGEYGPSIKSAFEPGSYYGINTENNIKTQPHNNMPPYVSVYMWKRTA